MNKDEALEIALDYIRRTSHWEKGRDRHDTLKAVEAALAQPWPDLTKRDRESYQKGHNDGVAHHKQSVKAAQLAQEPVREALKLALEALDDPSVLNGINNAKFFITQALAQPPLPVQRQPLTGEQAKKIFRMARELEDTGRLTSLSEGAEREAFLQKNREIQCALEDYLRNITETTPPLPVQEPDCQATGVCVRSGLYTAPLPVQPVRPWVGLTEKDFSAINQSCLTKLQAATSAESILKEKNNG